MNDCVFCKVIKGQLPSMKVYEDESTFAFMDIAKDVDGHILVVPKQHFKNILNCESSALVNVINTVKRGSVHLTESCGFSGVILLNARFERAVLWGPIFHIQIFPLKKHDGIDAWPAFSGATQNAEEIHKKVVMEK